MYPASISNHNELRIELKSLIKRRDEHEAIIINSGKEILETFLHPAELIKDSARGLAADKNFRGDLLKLGVNFISNYLTRKVTTTAVNAVVSTLFSRSQNTNKSENRKFTVLTLFSKLLPFGTKKKVPEQETISQHSIKPISQA